MANETIFPDCCGFVIINKFKGGHPGADPEACDSPQVVGKYLKAMEQKYYGARAGLLAVLSEPQNERVGKVFLDRKWVLKMDGLMNPRTGTKLFMYFRDLNPTPQRKKRIFEE